jgi:hypothetical protein
LWGFGFFYGGMMMLKIVLKEGRDKAVLRGHPWVFADAIAQIVGAI